MGPQEGQEVQTGRVELVPSVAAVPAVAWPHTTMQYSSGNLPIEHRGPPPHQAEGDVAE